MFKDIVINLSVDPAADPVVPYAVSVAEAFSAHLAAIAVTYDPEFPPQATAVAAKFIDQLRTETERAAAAARARFDEAARRTGLSAESHVLKATVAGAYPRFGTLARRFDLSIIGQARPDGGDSEGLIEGALFESGRPVIVVPYIQASGLKLDRVMACWDGSRAAARAIADAMPLLTRAKKVDVVIVDSETARSDEMPGADIAAHLARHELKLTVERIARGDVDVATNILNYAADQAADMIVMGGYGHSRLRQFILGGTTRAILRAMTVPTLMSH